VASYAADNEIARNEIDGAMCGELVDGGRCDTIIQVTSVEVHERSTNLTACLLPVFTLSVRKHAQAFIIT
jgi:hypothetical protein